MKELKVGIIGATGYGGLELIRFLHNHPEVEKIELFTSSEEGAVFSSKFGHLLSIHDTPLQKIDVETLAGFDVVFTSTPSGVTSKLLPPLVGIGPKLIDLSGDYRLKDLASYEKWYKKSPAPQNIVKDSVYGLTEWNEANIKSASLIANPGCYPTAVLLSLLPLIKERLIDPDYLVIDAKSGVSGAGNKPSQTTHYSEMNENFSIYKVNEHQHIPEIEQQLLEWNEEIKPITFSTHLLPISRGIMATIYVQVQKGITLSDIYKIYEEHYQNDSFVRVRPEGHYPAVKEVCGSNFCDIGLHLDERTGRLTIVSVIDNLMKGAAGQAVQNANIMTGLDETTGLTFIPMYP